MLLAPFMMMNKEQAAELQASQLASVKKPNMNESHVKRARLQLEKKKKQFEQPNRLNGKPTLNNPGFN